MSHKYTRFGYIAILIILSPAHAQSTGEESKADIDVALKQSLLRILSDNPKPTVNDQAATTIWSRRADALLFLERFDEAVAEYEQMVLIDPALRQSHWRLGIAYFFNSQPNKAVQIFEAYHSFDDVDRENGIWRYLSQYKASDAATAKKELLRYKKDDRQPFPAVYRLFDGTMTTTQVIDSIPEKASTLEREQGTFYIRLYCGMLSVVKEDKTEAIKHLKQAVASKWPQKAGFGPNYMWHVARVQLNQLSAARN